MDSIKRHLSLIKANSMNKSPIISRITPSKELTFLADQPVCMRDENRGNLEVPKFLHVVEIVVSET